MAPRSGAREALDALHRRGLAGAVRPDQAEDLALLHVERDVVDGDRPAVGLADGGDVDDGVAGHAQGGTALCHAPPGRFGRSLLAALAPKRGTLDGVSSPSAPSTDDPINLDRQVAACRELIGGLAATSMAATQIATAAETAAISNAPPAFRGQHVIQPLPFNASKLTGLSEKLLVSHHDNNYGGAINNLNRVEQELARINKDTPAFLVRGLRQSELTFHNSMTLHEAYFGNLGGSGKASGAIATALSTAYQPE